MIELIHLVKRFGDLVAVNAVDLVVPRGQFFALLGPERAQANDDSEDPRRLS